MRIGRTICALLLYLALSLLLTTLAQAQATGAFSGMVLDEDGAPLPGVTATFRRIDVSLDRQVDTDSQGRFYYGGLPPGRYRVSVRRAGRVIWSSEAFLPPGSTLEFTVDLKKMREEAERLGRLDPELERLRDAERLRQAREDARDRHYMLGARYLNEGQPELAIGEYQALLDEDPTRATAHAMLGAAYAAARRLPEAAAIYRRAIELEPNEAAHYNNLGLVLVRSGQVEEGLRQVERATRLDPERAATYSFNVGAILLNAGRPPEALSPLRQAVKQDPTFALGHYFLGVTLFKTSPRRSSTAGEGGVVPRAGTVEAFQRYLQLAPDGPYAEQARSYLQQLGAPPVPSTAAPPATKSLI